MSYCRAYDDNNQVYLYGDINGQFCCCGCKLTRTLKFSQDNSVWLPTRTSAILHLRHHRLAGHKFPRRAERQLIQELKEEGEFVIKGFIQPRPWEEVQAEAVQNWRDNCARRNIPGQAEDESDKDFVLRCVQRSRREMKKMMDDMEKNIQHGRASKTA